MYTVNEYIARYKGDTLYAKDVGLYFRRKNIFIDTTHPTLTKNLAIAYELRKEGVEVKAILDKLIKYHLLIGSLIYCDYEGYGSGQVTELFNSGNMFVKFKERRLPTMCDSKTTIHDEKKRKIRIIA